MKLAAVAVMIVAIAFGLLMVVFRSEFNRFTSLESPSPSISVARQVAPPKEVAAMTTATGQVPPGTGRLRPWMDRPKSNPTSQAVPPLDLASAGAALDQQLLEEQERLVEWSASLAEREEALLDAEAEQQALFDQQAVLFDEQQQLVDAQQEDLQWTQAEVDAAWQEQQLAEDQLLAEQEQILAEQEQLLEEQALLDEQVGNVEGGGGVVYLPGYGGGVPQQPSQSPATGSSERPEFQNGTRMPAPIARMAPPIPRMAAPIPRMATPIPRTANPAVRAQPSPVTRTIPSVTRSVEPTTRSLPPAPQRAK